MLHSLVRAARDGLSRYFFPLSIGGTIAVLTAVALYLPGRFVVYGLYGLFGLLGGATIYYRRAELPDVVQRRGDIFQWSGDGRRYGPVVYAASAIAVGVVALTDRPLFVVLGLGFGYALVVRQLLGTPDPAALVPQLTVLFVLSPLAKYLTAGRYVGHSDVLTHARLVDEVIAGGSLDAIAYASYQEFPGLHLVAGTVASLAGVSGYDGLMLVTLGAYLVVVPAVYLVASALTGDRVLALTAAFGAAVLDDLSFYVSYAFPQSLAVVLFAVLAVLAAVADRDAVTRPAVGGFVLVAVAVAYVHHLTQLFFVPVLCCVGAGYALLGDRSPRRLLRSRPVALVGVAMLVSGVRIWQTGFVGRLVEPATQVVRGGPLGGYSQGVTRAYGVGLQSTSVVSAAEWLVSPYGLYGILLLSVFSLGVVGLLRYRGSAVGYTAFAWAGVAGALLVFETPLSIPSLIRIRAPWLFVFAFVVGLGVYQLRDRLAAVHTSRLVVALLVVLAAVGPLVTADNYYGLDPRPTSQTSFSDAEYRQLEATTSFVADSDAPTTTFWLTRLVMAEGTGGEPDRVTVRDGRIHIPPGHYVYRSSWADHKVQFTAGSGESVYSNTLYLSEAWLSQRVGTGSQVYTAGGTGVLWSPRERPLGTAVDDTNQSARS